MLRKDENNKQQISSTDLPFVVWYVVNSNVALIIPHCPCCGMGTITSSLLFWVHPAHWSANEVLAKKGGQQCCFLFPHWLHLACCFSDVAVSGMAMRGVKSG